MQKNKVVPLKRKWQEESPETGQADDKLSPLNRMRERLGRFTKHWPITISSTFIFNLKPVCIYSTRFFPKLVRIAQYQYMVAFIRCV